MVFKGFFGGNLIHSYPTKGCADTTALKASESGQRIGSALKEDDGNFSFFCGGVKTMLFVSTLKTVLGFAWNVLFCKRVSLEGSSVCTFLMRFMSIYKALNSRYCSRGVFSRTAE